MKSSQAAFARRAQYCEERIRAVSSGLLKAARPSIPDNFCAYVTGSYGRLEASPHSDIDIFFVLNDLESNVPLPRVGEYHIYSALAKVCKALRLPDFSNDGEYLRVHKLSEILENVGNPKDDFSNNFTARMLLLLESRPLANDGAYDQVLKSIIKDYFRDYPGHDADFRPVFLMNDIVRFWKTLCLNYESKRNLTALRGANRTKAQIRNLKLKFSRMATCYSMIAELIAAPKITPMKVLAIAKRTPIERLQNVAVGRPSPVSTRITRLLSLYSWFLANTSRNHTDAISWLQKEKNRNEAFEQAQRFSLEMFELLLELSKTGEGRTMLRYLLI